MAPATGELPQLVSSPHPGSHDPRGLGLAASAKQPDPAAAGQREGAAGPREKGLEPGAEQGAPRLPPKNGSIYFLLARP